jgi:hypothetical protein
MSEENPHPQSEDPKSEDLLFDEFEPDDPRRGPHLQETRTEAAALARAPNRWHARNPRVDWLAVRLQFGRGLKSYETALMFSIGLSTIDRRRCMERWLPLLAEVDRRRLSAIVWLAGVARLDLDDPTARDTLKAASEWRSIQRPAPLVWREKEPLGEPLRFVVNDP